MKLITSVILASALVVGISAFGQGKININSNSGTIVKAPIYNVFPGDNTRQLQGNTSAGIVAGTQNYGGAAVLDSNYYAEVVSFAGSTTNPDLVVDSVAQVSVLGAPVALKGFINVGERVVAGTTTGGTATFVVRAWPKTFNAQPVATWNEAMANPLIPKGWSKPFTVSGLGGPQPPDPDKIAPVLVGMESFNLFVPEPSVIALGVLGLGALVLFRRR